MSGQGGVRSKRVPYNKGSYKDFENLIEDISDEEETRDIYRQILPMIRQTISSINLRKNVNEFNKGRIDSFYGQETSYGYEKESDEGILEEVGALIDEEDEKEDLNYKSQEEVYQFNVNVDTEIEQIYNLLSNSVALKGNNFAENYVSKEGCKYRNYCYRLVKWFKGILKEIWL